jgi:hypothetical protein
VYFSPLSKQGKIFNFPCFKSNVTAYIDICFPKWSQGNEVPASKEKFPFKPKWGDGQQNSWAAGLQCPIHAFI